MKKNNIERPMTPTPYIVEIDGSETYYCTYEQAEFNYMVLLKTPGLHKLNFYFDSWYIDGATYSDFLRKNEVEYTEATDSKAGMLLIKGIAKNINFWLLIEAIPSEDAYRIVGVNPFTSCEFLDKIEQSFTAEADEYFGGFHSIR